MGADPSQALPRRNSSAVEWTIWSKPLGCALGSVGGREANVERLALLEAEAPGDFYLVQREIGPWECSHRDSITCGNDGFLTCLDCGAETPDIGRVKVFIAALVEIATRATVERNPDGVEQAAHTMQLIAREALGMES